MAADPTEEVWSRFLDEDDTDCDACHGQGTDRWGDDCPDCGGLGVDWRKA